MAEFAKGQKVRHVDGSLGTITCIREGKEGERLIEWKSLGRWRVSGENALKDATNEPLPRWRTNEQQSGK